MDSNLLLLSHRLLVPTVVSEKSTHSLTLVLCNILFVSDHFDALLLVFDAVWFCFDLSKMDFLLCLSCLEFVGIPECKGWFLLLALIFFNCLSLRISLPPFCYLFLGLQLKYMFFPLSLCYWCFQTFYVQTGNPRVLILKEQAGRKGRPRVLLLSGSVGEV